MAKQVRMLAGQTVAITGGARGIGRATAIALSRDRASFTSFLDAVEQRLAPIDVLINNAGIMHVGRFVDEDDLTARRMVDINLHGVILGTKLALDRMVPRNRGHIVNISSQAGKYGSPGGATYSATKHAVVGLTEAVRGELALMGADVDVSYVMPFVVNTELGSGLGEARGMQTLQPSDVADAIVDALERRIVDVWVPKSAKPTQLIGSLLPRRLSEAVAKAMKANLVLAGADAGARRDYELRAAASEPSLEAGSQASLKSGSEASVESGSQST